MGLNKEEKTKMIQLFHQKNDSLIQHIKIAEMDTKNGYLSLSGGFEGSYNLCYWVKKDKSHLIAIYSEACGPVCYVVNFDFYELSKSKLKNIPSNQVIPEISRDFYRPNPESAKAEMLKKDIICSELYSLPKKGLDIMVRVGNEGSKEEYTPYLKGNRMKLLWNNGTFKKSAVYWEN